MQNSSGKDAARAFFYNECLPAFISGERLRSSDILMLLGEESLEIPLLDGLRIPRRNLHSVERNFTLFARQARQNLGISLFFGELVDYLKMILHTNQGFGVLNLDVEGTYFTHIDPAMTHVLLFCWRNPETVIATYSSISRDRQVLWEGIRSFAFLSWIVPSCVSMVARMSHAYAKAGFEEPLRMALRDMLWIRSILEHAVRASVIAGVTPEGHFQRLLAMEDRMWGAIAKKHKHPLRLSDILEEISALPVNHTYLPYLGIHLKDMRHVTYGAKRPWSQRCYFTKFELCDTPMSCKDWLWEVCQLFADAPYVHFKRDGSRKEITEEEDESIQTLFKSVIWSGEDIYEKFHPRKLKSDLLVVPNLASVSNTVRIIRERTIKQKKDTERKRTS